MARVFSIVNVCCFYELFPALKILFDTHILTNSRKNSQKSMEKREYMFFLYWNGKSSKPSQLHPPTHALTQCIEIT